jgi:phosphoserine phosphatase RsbU/P
VEVLNCGHVPPLLIANGQPKVLKHGNLPVGLMPIAEYESHKVELNPGDRLILVTDGVTEAEDCSGEMYGEERLQQAAVVTDGPCFDHIFASIRQFCGDVPLNDDCTLLELVYRGKSKNNTDSGMSLKT